MKTFKEYMNYIGGVRLGNPSDNVTPIASLGDVPPKNQAGKDSRGVGLTSGSRGLPLNANATTHGKGTIKPMITASKATDKMKAQLKSLGKRIKSFRDKAFKKTMSTVKSPLFAGEDTKRIPRKKGQPAGSDKHSDLYTDENPKGTIHGLGFTDSAKAKQSVSKIRNSGKTHAHKMQAAIAMSQRAKVASQRAKDPQKKKDLGQAHRVYQSYIDKNKKSKD
jgi:hypothetical protein